MAMHATHLILAEPFLDWMEKQGCSEEEKGLLVLGILFPDIRYVVPGLSREETHPLPKNLSQKELSSVLQDIFAALRSGDPFQTGILIHDYTDELRIRLQENSPVPLRPGIAWTMIETVTSQADSVLKWIEDGILYPSWDEERWETLCSWARQAMEIPSWREHVLTAWPMEEASLDRWYRVSFVYLEHFDSDARFAFFRLLGQLEKGAILEDLFKESLQEASRDWALYLQSSFAELIREGESNCQFQWMGEMGAVESPMPWSLDWEI